MHSACDQARAQLCSSHYRAPPWDSQAESAASCFGRSWQEAWHREEALAIAHRYRTVPLEFIQPITADAEVSDGGCTSTSPCLTGA